MLCNLIEQCISLCKGCGKLAYNSLLVHSATCKDKKVCKACSGWEKQVIIHLLKMGEVWLVVLNQLHFHSEKLVTAVNLTAVIEPTFCKKHATIAPSQ